MSKIRVLSEVLANKIAAGEVVERPASVVKELVENALDAGASSVEVEIGSAGRQLIRVADDGEGMTRDDAILAFERHATSKLRTAEDLSAIETFGFRGEALPSIASVSRLTLRTRTAADPAGTMVVINGGKLGDVRDVAWPVGTEVAIRDLFFNMPARRKFLKSDATETYHVANLVTHYALANHGVAFSLESNGRETIRVAPVTDLRERAYQLLGPVIVDRLVEVADESGGLAVSGYVSNPQEQRTTREAQYLFVNGRYVRDRTLARSIAEGYRSMMPSGTYPAAMLFLRIPTDRVDVNVHPAKIEVRFRDEYAVRQLVASAIRAALDRATRPVAIFPRAEAQEDRPADVAIRSAEAPPLAQYAPSRPLLPSEPTSRPAQSALGLDYSAGVRSAPVPTSPPPEPRTPPTSIEERGPVDITAAEPAMDSVQDGTPARPSAAGLPAPRDERLAGHIRPLGQIRESFIVATDDEGLLLIDQHVAHERVLFERIRDRIGAESPVRQQLLVPETVDLTPAQAAAFDRLQPELEAAGFDVLTLSGRTIAVTAVPGELPAGEVRALLVQILDAAEGRGRSSLEGVREDIAASLACRAAIKINMPLTMEKMNWLIDELLAAHNPWTCPHGRPIILRFTLRDIERQFQRP
jgi:DNA mismatch repair protein MutL